MVSPSMTDARPLIVSFPLGGLLTLGVGGLDGWAIGAGNNLKYPTMPTAAKSTTISTTGITGSGLLPNDRAPSANN